MFKCFYPDAYVASTYVIPFEKLKEEGVKGIIFDIDNTLVEHGVKADDRAKALFKKLEALEIKACLMSNNQEPRVKSFNEEIGVPYISNAHKPAKGNYLKAMELMGTNSSNTVFVGDQLFTDVFGAKRVGIRNYLVKPIHPSEEIQIVLKRYLEKIVLYFYKREKKVEKRDKML